MDLSRPTCRSLPVLPLWPHNARPEWLRRAHADLDRAVFAAYGWDTALSDDGLLAALLALNLQRERA
jgi:hypothetical protein